MAILITGVAGFIGSNLAKRLTQSGNMVFGIDNLSNGSIHNIDSLEMSASFIFESVEMNDLNQYQQAIQRFSSIEPILEVWHLAANSDIPAGVNDSNVDLADTFMTTFNTLQLMKKLSIGKILFASSSAIYGDLGDVSISEDMGPLKPISNYGAMKLASEAAICAFTESALEQSFIFRFPNVIGIPATHGVILDFIRRLRENPSSLNVLGNGTQQKGYLHVNDLIDAMLFIRAHSEDKISIYNIGSDDEGVSVKIIAEETIKVISPNASITYGSQNRGWVGDVPRFSYNINKLKSLGWQPKLSSREAVLKAILEIADQNFSTQ